jgi:predicted RNA methylase
MTARDGTARSFDDVAVFERLRAMPQLIERVRTTTGPELAVQAELRREYPEDLVRAALLLEELRNKARAKFRMADQMWFDREGLEQATSEPVARHKARRFAAVARPVLDLCCGIGADSIALADGGDVRAVDLRESACRMTEWNAEAYGVRDRVTTEVADVESLPLGESVIHIDPDRRPAGRRSLKIEEHRPSLPFLQALTERASGGAIKLSPASNFGGKFPGCEIELVSFDGECKEAVVWFGALRTDTEWRATVLPSGDSLTGDPWTARSEVSNLQRFLLDPDPAVVRAGLVDVLAEQSGWSRLDPAEEYLTAEHSPDSPFVQTFEVLADLSNNNREIRAWFRTADCGQLEVKCRRIPVSPEKVRQHLDLSGTAALVLVFARIGGRARAVACRRVARGGGESASKSVH